MINIQCANGIVRSDDFNETVQTFKHCRFLKKSNMTVWDETFMEGWTCKLNEFVNIDVALKTIFRC